MSEWLCREEGVTTTSNSTLRDFKLVLAEPLASSPSSHVAAYLREHGGPGVQHIGLTTNTMAHTITSLRCRIFAMASIRELIFCRADGARFRQPPPTYYTLEGKAGQIEGIGGQPDVFARLGILIDPEVVEDEEGVILQIFTFPMFTENTFFMEVIERQGAGRGFGAGNILALALSIELLAQAGEGQVGEVGKVGEVGEVGKVGEWRTVDCAQLASLQPKGR